MHPRWTDTTGVILAGGKSRRFGENKAFAEFKGRPLIDRVYDVQTSLFSEVILVTNSPQDYLSLPITILQDEIPYQGPLGGILTALHHIKTPYAFVTACDMPLLDPQWVSRVVQGGRGYQACLPVYGDHKEYLMALYSRSLISSIENYLEEGHRSLKDFFKNLSQVNTLSITSPSTFNVNTKADLAHLEQENA